MAVIFLKNGKVIDVVRKYVTRKDLWINGDKITFIRPKHKPHKTINLKGSYISPGFIDGHIHIETSMISPLEFAYEAVKHGTTSVFADPRKITNVFGEKGIQLFLNLADIVPFTMNIAVPDVLSVPATEKFLQEKKVYGLGEVTDVEGIISDRRDARKKVRVALEAGKIVAGHCPALSGKDLKKYISNGEPDSRVRISSDHGSANYYEALEKWENGMYVMLGTGSGLKDFENIFPKICGHGLCFNEFGIVSDELLASNFYKNGHINHVVDMAKEIIQKEKKVGPVKAAIEAISLATINHAKHFRQNTGRIEEGAFADIIAFDSLEKISPHLVISGGRVIVEKHKHTEKKPAYNYKEYHNSLIGADNLAREIVLTSAKKKQSIKVIDVNTKTLAVNEFLTEVPVKEKLVRFEPESGILKMAARKRRGNSKNVKVSFIRGIDMKAGAIAFTSGDDNNSFIVIGTNETSMIRAVEKMRRAGGGIAAVFNEKTEILPLSIGGIMSPKDINAFLVDYTKLLRLINDMGVTGEAFAAILRHNLLVS